MDESRRPPELAVSLPSPPAAPPRPRFSRRGFPSRRVRVGYFVAHLFLPLSYALILPFFPYSHPSFLPSFPISLREQKRRRKKEKKRRRKKKRGKTTPQKNSNQKFSPVGRTQEEKNPPTKKRKIRKISPRNRGKGHKKRKTPKDEDERTLKPPDSDLLGWWRRVFVPARNVAMRLHTRNDKGKKVLPSKC